MVKIYPPPPLYMEQQMTPFCVLSLVSRMSVEVESLLQEVKECIEAAQNYRSELQQRLQGLSQARKQVNTHTAAFHKPIGVL